MSFLHTGNIFVFGKVPHFADFVCAGLDGFPWIQGPMEDFAIHAAFGNPEPWHDLSHLPRLARMTRRSVFRGSTASLLMSPSGDRHGRRFPLVVGLVGESQKGKRDRPSLQAGGIDDLLDAWKLSTARRNFDFLFAWMERVDRQCIRLARRYIFEGTVIDFSYELFDQEQAAATDVTS